MKIAGIIKSSMIDFPQKASTVIFIGGCNFRCGYCHNPEIVYNSTSSIELEDLFVFLEKRKRFIDAVSISGGEPTIHSSLVKLIRRIKGRGLAVKLDTNGTNPSMLRILLEEGLLDYVAMDIKGPMDLYESIARTNVDIRAIKESSDLLINHNAISENFNYEFRTTVCRELLNEADLHRMINEHPRAEKWYIQTYKDSGTILDEKGSYSPYTKPEMEGMGRRLCVSVR